MKSLKIFCLSLNNEDYEKIISLGYTPVGVGNQDFDTKWLRDNTGENISEKNNFYGEYSFHYWLWNNKFKEIKDNTWVGFCAYRRFWQQENVNYFLKKKNDFLSTVPNSWEHYDVILGQDIHMDGWTPMKIFKHGLKSYILNPKFFLKKNRNIKLHFDSFHGYGNLDKAINLLDESEKEDFRKFTRGQNFYNRGNMFICRSKKIMNSYYNSLFPWLERCEKIFGLNKTNYGNTRIYAFLGERYLSYWFNKYAKVLKWPIVFFNLNKERIEDI